MGAQTRAMHAALPRAPSRLLPAWSRIVRTPRVLGHNDKVGDCVIVAGFNAVQTALARRGNFTSLPEDLPVRIYSSLTGYVPGDESTDNGTDPEMFLAWWKVNAIAGYRLGRFIRLNPADVDGIRNAVAGLGCYLCVELSTANEEQAVWRPDGFAGSWGGHAVWADEYEAADIGVCSWGGGYGIDGAYFAAPGFVSAAFALELEQA
ncbi:hypothetical protein [Acidocella sp.]|uniref:hypothetical protein n=2 Tax=Acidocella sp. TaxID=50710 RepID=UPI00260F6E74|nr:hypothetical protein [Acidocella sp.]